MSNNQSYNDIDIDKLFEKCIEAFRKNNLDLYSDLNYKNKDTVSLLNKNQNGFNSENNNDESPENNTQNRDSTSMKMKIKSKTKNKSNIIKIKIKTNKKIKIKKHNKINDVKNERECQTTDNTDNTDNIDIINSINNKNKKENCYKIFSNIIDNDTCEFCGDTTSIIESDGKLICTNCGCINNRIILSTRRKMGCNGGYSGKNEGGKGSKDLTQSGIINPLLPQSSLATTMTNKGCSRSYGRRGYISTLQNWNNIPYSEKALIEIFALIDSKCKEGNLPQIVADRTKLMFKTLKDEKILKREDPKKALIASCIYYVCKAKNIPITIKELAVLFNINKKQITTGCKLFHEVMFINNIEYLITINPITYNDCIDIVSEKLGFSKKYIFIIKNLAQMADKFGIVRQNTPPSIAVSCIQMFINAIGLNISKKLLSTTSNVSEVTISKTYNKIYPYRKFLFLFYLEK